MGGVVGRLGRQDAAAEHEDQRQDREGVAACGTPHLRLVAGHRDLHFAGSSHGPDTRDLNMMFRSVREPLTRVN